MDWVFPNSMTWFLDFVCNNFVVVWSQVSMITKLIKKILLFSYLALNYVVSWKTVSMKFNSTLTHFILLLSGTWSSKAAKEAAKYGKVNLAFPKPAKFGSVPPQSTWNLNPNASYVYYCANETVDGNYISSYCPQIYTTYRWWSEMNFKCCCRCWIPVHSRNEWNPSCNWYVIQYYD